jgi:hypothetical protein
MRTTSILIVSCIVPSCLLHSTAQDGSIMNAPKYLGLERGLVGFWSFDGKHMSGNHASDLSGRGWRSAWMARAAHWTISLSNGYGGQSHMQTFT